MALLSFAFEVSSRSHTLLTLCVECSVPLEDSCDFPPWFNSSFRCSQDDDTQSVTRVGRLVIVDLAGNERLEAQPLDFLGKEWTEVDRSGEKTALEHTCFGDLTNG